ncbi:MAG: CoA ester lyase [Pseudomonadota bacterium]
MRADDRPRRSVLYMPGSNARALEKARSLPADALILDLEDAVLPSEKTAARTQVAEAVRARGFGRREVAIRINGLDTPWGHDDLAAAVAAAPDAILVPKVGRPEDLRPVEAAVGPDGPAIWAMMETPAGILQAEAIAAGVPRLVAFILGTNDLVKELGAAHVPGRAPVATSLSLCLLAARAHGLACIDGVFNDLGDADGLAAECAAGRDMGFDGKTLIHPGQIDAANRAFAPSDAALTLARRQVAAFAEAEAAGQGVAVLDGRIVEHLHVESARRLLAQAEAIAALEATPS